jgi:hypothetical protein
VKNTFPESDSQTKRQRNSQSKTVSQHGKSDFNIGKLKHRFNTRTPKNLKEHQTAHPKNQNTNAHNKKQPNSTIITHQIDMFWILKAETQALPPAHALKPHAANYRTEATLTYKHKP